MIKLKLNRPAGGSYSLEGNYIAGIPVFIHSAGERVTTGIKLITLEEGPRCRAEEMHQRPQVYTQIFAAVNKRDSLKLT